MTLDDMPVILTDAPQPTASTFTGETYPARLRAPFVRLHS